MAAWLGVLSLLSACFWSGYCFRWWRERRTHARRRGGYLAPATAFAFKKAGTAVRVETSTECSPGGAWQAGTAGPDTPAEPSRTFVLTGFGAATGGSRGAAEPPTTAPSQFTELHPWGWSRKVPPA